MICIQYLLRFKIQTFFVSRRGRAMCVATNMLPNKPPWILFLLTISTCTGYHDKYSEDQNITLAAALKNTTIWGLKYIGDMIKFREGELNDMTPSNKAEYDFIIVGAGSAGAALAHRLTEISDINVLLIEAGGIEELVYDIPLQAFLLQFIKLINWDYRVEPSKNYCRGMTNNQCVYPQGKVMGGTSTINAMIATRGNRLDYDRLADKGNEGWAYKDVLKYFKKLENFEIPNVPYNEEYHNKGGPVHIGWPPYHSPISSAFFEAAKELNFSIVDYNGKEQAGFSYLQSTVKDGERWSANRAYLRPIKNRKNLFVTQNSFVTKVLIDPKTKKAYGVKFIKNSRTIEVRAKKEIIICTGGINSPKILMLSGIGPAKHLRSVGVNVIHDSKEVGNNLMDHMTYWNLNFLINETSAILAKRFLELKNPSFVSYLKDREGPATVTGGAEAVAFLDVDDPYSPTAYPNIEILFSGASVASDRFFYKTNGISREHYLASLGNMLDKNVFEMMITLIGPKSKGKVLLRSKNPKDKPIILPNYFDHPNDVRLLTKGIRLALELSKTSAFQAYGAHLPQNPILGCENFEFDSDEYWDCAIRTFCGSLYHPVGTCKMGPKNDTTAVVNPRLQVNGVKGLRVGDASVFPEIITAHTNIPSIMIGEKLADMLKEDWNLE